MSTGIIKYMCINKQFADVIEKYSDNKQQLLNGLFTYGSSDDIEKYISSINIDDTLSLSKNVVLYITSDQVKIKLAFQYQVISASSVYQILKANYKYIQYISDLQINVCRVVLENAVPFKFILEEFLKAKYTYEDIIRSRYNGCYLLGILIDKNVEPNDVISWMNVLFGVNVTLLIKFMRISDYTVLSDNDDSDLHQKIIKYLTGRKLLKEVRDSDPYLVKLLDICKDI